MSSSLSLHSSFLLWLATLANLLFLASCFTFSFGLTNTHHHQPQSPPGFSRGLLFEEKTRLGSTPPSCHNKCNRCHPCMAVQVPSMPSHDQIRPESTTKMELLDPLSSSQSSSSSNRYSNYKPLGWKCRCGNHIFNP